MMQWHTIEELAGNQTGIKVMPCRSGICGRNLSCIMGVLERIRLFPGQQVCQEIVAATDKFPCLAECLHIILQGDVDAPQPSQTL